MDIFFGSVVILVRRREEIARHNPYKRMVSGAFLLCHEESSGRDFDKGIKYNLIGSLIHSGWYYECVSNRVQESTNREFFKQ
jgi:hypothetical protein